MPLARAIHGRIPAVSTRGCGPVVLGGTRRLYKMGAGTGVHQRMESGRARLLSLLGECRAVDAPANDHVCTLAWTMRPDALLYGGADDADGTIGCNAFHRLRDYVYDVRPWYFYHWERRHRQMRVLYDLHSRLDEAGELASHCFDREAVREAVEAGTCHYSEMPMLYSDIYARDEAFDCLSLVSRVPGALQGLVCPSREQKMHVSISFASRQIFIYPRVNLLDYTWSNGVDPEMYYVHVPCILPDSPISADVLTFDDDVTFDFFAFQFGHYQPRYYSSCDLDDLYDRWQNPSHFVVAE